MTATALTVTELEARASAIDSVLALARVHLERNAQTAQVGLYLYQGRHHFKKLIAHLNRSMDDLRVGEVDEIAAALSATSRRFGHVVRAEPHLAINLFEHMVRKQVIRLFDDVDHLVEQLRDHSATLKREAPTVNASLQREAMMASALMRSVTPDPAERHPDPDYGF